MDLKQQIDQLDEVIKNFDSNIQTMKQSRKFAFKKRAQFLRLLSAAEALEEQKSEKAKDIGVKA